MNRSLVKNLSICTGNRLPSFLSKLNPHQLSPIPSSSSSLNHGRVFCSGTSKPSESNFGQSPEKDETFEAENTSNEELKKQIEKLYEGDEGAFASVFEAILRRKLAGKSEELDEELINELPNHQHPHDTHDNHSDSD